MICHCAEADGKKGKEEKPEPEANFALSGKLAAESNTVNGVVLVHQEPPESRKPSQMWRLYGFKNGQCLSHICLEGLLCAFCALPGAFHVPCTLCQEPCVAFVWGLPAFLMSASCPPKFPLLQAFEKALSCLLFVLFLLCPWLCNGCLSWSAFCPPWFARLTAFPGLPPASILYNLPPCFAPVPRALFLLEAKMLYMFQSMLPNLAAWSDCFCILQQMAL